MAMANSDFIHGNWNPARSSTNNIFIKSGKGTKNAKVHSKVVRSHEYPPSNLGGGGAIYANRDIIREANYQRYHQHHHQHHLHQNNDDGRIYYDGNSGGIPNRYDFNNASIIYGSSSGSSLGTRYGYQYRSNPQISFSNSLGDTTVTTGSSAAADDFDTLSTTYDKSSCNPVRLAVSRNSNKNAQKRASGEHSNAGNGMSSGQQIQKWKNDFTAAASGLNRKWCDFVFRRNEDNRVYRSESFRFIQKTNSLSLLTPISPSGLQAQRNNRKRISLHGISVNDDYIDPVDHVLNLSPSVAPHNNNCNQLDSVREGAWSASGSTSGVSGDTSSGGSRKSGLTSDGGTSSTNFEGDDREGDTDKGEPPYHEILERYNAPYYYSDTIKEPTYINPCENQENDDEPEDVQGSSGNASAGCSSLSNTCSPSSVLSDTLEPVTVTIVTTNTAESEETEQEILRRPVPGIRKQNKLNRRSAYLRGSSRELMARKRYETAFLPSSSPHASSSQTTPDIDSLLLAIESSCHLGQGQHGYVTKTDITSSTHPAKTGASSSSSPPNEEPEVPPPPHQKYQQDGRADKHVIYISHSPSYATNNALSTNQMSTGEQQQQQYPISSCPSSVPPETTSATAAAVITSSSNNCSQLPQNYHPHRSSSIVEACSSTEIAGSNASLQTNPSTSSSYCQSHHHHHFQHHHHPHHLHHNLNINLMPTVVRTSGLCTTTNSSPLATHKLASKPIMPLSEPLPQKRYIGKGGISSSHHHTNTSSSSSSSSNSGGPGETRRLGHNLKDNSVSSLESIDSTKSEELSSSLNRHSTTNYHHYQHNNYQPQKLLSPISDKSPLEPLANSHGGGSHHSSELDGNLEVEGIHQNRPKWSNTISLLDAAELTNVPWEMPKLRRKLAKLADSGISLDFSGSGSKETDCAAIAASGNCGGSGSASGTGGAGGGHGSFDFSLGRSSNSHTYATTVPTAQHQGGGGGSGVGGASGSQGQSRKEMAASSLQLSFDDGGLTRDEYYEDPNYTVHDHQSRHGEMALGYGGPASSSSTRQGFLTASKIPGSAIVEDVTSVQVHVPQQEQQQQPQGKHGSAARPDRCRMKLDFSSTRGLGGFGGGGGGGLGGLLLLPDPANVIDPNIELERQDWFHGAITRCEAENILRATKEGSFLVRNCESTTFNRYSLSLKSFRGCIHIRIEPNSLGTFSLGDQEFPSVPHLVLHFMSHRLPIKGAEHVRLMYPVITQLL